MFSPEIEKVILDAHNGRNRFYHTSKHIESMLQYIPLIKQEVHKMTSDAVYLAIMFHDIEYSVVSTTNEESSVATMKRFLNKHQHDFADYSIEVAEMMILATKTHKVPCYLDSLVNKALRIFLDLDLLILSSDNIDEFENQIREEYCIYPNETYIPSRIKVLESFLQKESIYGYFYPYEEKARENINYLIQKLNHQLLMDKLKT